MRAPYEPPQAVAPQVRAPYAPTQAVAREAAGAAPPAAPGDLAAEAAECLASP